MEPESVHCVVTSPPYWGLRDYGVPGQLGLEPTPKEYVADMVAVFREVRRVLRADGTVWLNLGDSYARQGGKTDGLPRHWDGRENDPSGMHAKRSLASEFGAKPKDLIGIPWRVAFALQADGWYLRSDIIWAKPNPMPESVTDRPTKSHEYVFLLSKSARYFYDADAVREADGGRGSGQVARKYRIDAGGNPNHPGNQGYAVPWEPNSAGRNLRSVWTIATQPYPGAHFATFPEALVEPCVKAGCPEGGVVLDPFAGSGTTGRVANRLSRRAVLIELKPDYIDQAMLRNSQAPLGLNKDGYGDTKRRAEPT
jgi:DNA modification methylase